MSVEPARVLLDPKTMEFATVPRDEVPDGYLRIHHANHGTFFAAPSFVEAGLGGPTRHGPFPDAARAEIARYMEVFRDVYRMTAEQWESEFRIDRNPWSEMAKWDVIAKAFQKFTANLDVSDPYFLKRKADTFQLIMRFINNGQVRSGNFKAFQSQSPDRVRRVHDFIFSKEMEAYGRTALEKYRDMLRDLVLESQEFPDRVTIDSLCDEDGKPNLSAPFSVWEWVGTADIIVAEDVSDPKKKIVVHGRKLLERIRDTGVSVPGRAVTVEMDIDTDDFERLLGITMGIKGNCEYLDERK